MRFRFLGTGTSVGVPQIGCGCPVCTSADPRDRRRRCGAYVVADDGTAFLIDTPPELREACLAYGVSKVDAVLLTHAHMDHVAGFDDVRRFNTINGEVVPCDPSAPGANGRTFRIVGKPMDCWALPETIDQMHRIFPYIGTQGGERGLFRPQVEFRENTAPFTLGSIRIEAFRVAHGFPCCGYLLSEERRAKGEERESEKCTVNGERLRPSSPRLLFAAEEESRRVHNLSPFTFHLSHSIARPPCGGRAEWRLAYVSDCHEMDDATVERLRGVDVMVLNCLREREHPTHLSLRRARAYLERIGAKKAYLVHMCHDLKHTEWLERLAGTGAEPAYDGLEVEL